MNVFLNKGEKLNTLPPILKTANEQFNDFIDAFNVILTLRNADGVVKADSSTQWMFVLKPYRHAFKLELVRVKDLAVKLGAVSPTFENKQNAVDALELVGEWKLAKAIQTLSGV